MDYSTLQPKLSFTTPLKHSRDNSEEWQGQRSQRFGRSVRFQPHKDLIRTNFDMPNQSAVTGRVHYNEPTSFEKPQRPIVHKVPPIKHWCLRESKIRTMEFKPTQHARRPERFHNNEIKHDLYAYNPEGLRTFYIKNRKTERQYSVENRMQTKGRIDQAELRRTFFKDVNIFQKS